MPRITVVELYRYRYWTETLGSDREWIIQSKQAEIYSLLQKLFSRNNGFVIPLRYDYYIALSNGISREVHEEIYTAVSSDCPVTVRFSSVPHKYPLTAEIIATKKLAFSTSNFIFIEGEESPIVVLHIDIDDIMRLTYETSIYETYLMTMKLYTNVIDVALRHGGIASYLGGDNIVAILPEDTYMEFIGILPEYTKTGVGIDYSPRRALELATKALDDIRRRRDKKFIVYRGA